MRRSLQARQSVRPSISNRHLARRRMSAAVSVGLFESLEQRRLLSSGQWYAVFGGMTPGTSLDQQMELGESLLARSGVSQSNVQVVEAMDFGGAFRLETPETTSLATLTNILDDVPGFIFADSYVESEIRKVLPKISLLENLHGPFDYDDYLSRIKNGEIGQGDGQVDSDPNNVLANNNAGSQGTSRFTQSETAIIAWDNNVVIGFNDSGSFALSGGNQFTGWSYSSDGGTTFTDGGLLPTSAVGDAGDPVLARDKVTGRIYFSTLGFSGAGTIQMWRSDDNGQSWMAPVNATPGGSSEDKQWHTVDNFDGAGQGNVYVLSRRFGAGPGIYFFRSTDGGATFGPNGGTLITTGQQGAYISVMPDHSILAFWHNSSTGQIMMRKSTDQGLTFSAPVVVTTFITPGGVNGDLGLTGVRQGTATPAGFRSSRFPHAAVNPVNGHIYVVHADRPAVGGTDKANIYMITSTDGGATWGAPVVVNDDATTTDQWMPTIAVTPDGSRVGVFYYSREVDPTNNNLFRYWGRIGTVGAGGVSFLPSFPVSDVDSLPEFGRDGIVNATYMSDYDMAAATPGAFHLVWSDNRDDLAGAAPRKDPNVYYKMIPLGLAVSSTVPAVGSVVSSAPSSFVVNFTDPIDGSSVDATDFEVNGIAATSFVIDDADTVTFSYLSSPVTGEGLQNMSLAGGAILRDGDGDPLLAFNGSFRYDALTLQVVSTSPAFPGGIFTLPGPFNFDVNFNEPINPASVATGDLVLSGVPGAMVTGFTVLDADTVRFNLSGITTEGTLTASIAANAIQDQFGNNGTAFSANYQVDIGTVPYPVPLLAKKPAGSLIYDPVASGIVSFAGDEDTFTLNLDPNQKISVLVTSAAGLRSEIELRAPNNALLASSTASAAGKNNLLQSISTTTGGLYLFRVRGADGTTGSFQVQVVLNAGLEEEGKLDGASNNTLGTSQNAGPTFLNLGTGLGSFSHGAVAGTTDFAGYSASAVPFAFEDISTTGSVISGLTNVDDAATSIPIGFTFPFYGANQSSVFVGSNGVLAFGSGVTTFTNSNLTTTPTQAVIAPFWDDLHTGGGVAGSNVFQQVLGTGANQHLTIQWNNVRFFSGGAAGDTITFQAQLFADGRVRFNYLDLVSGTAAGNNGASTTVGNKNAGVQGADRLLLAFNDGPNAFVGSGQSTLINVPNPTPDLYAVSLIAGQKVTISATNQTDGTGAGLDLALLDSGGGTLATGVGGATNLGDVISGFTPATTGTYYVRMAGASTVPYNVAVTRDGGFDSEDNDGFATAQDISGTRGALGAITGTAYQGAGVPFDFEDISGTGTVISGLTNVDDAAASIPIGFSFPFYGANESSVFVSSNGLMTFGTANTTFTNANLTTTPAQAAIAPFWEDMHTGGGAADSNVFFQVSGSGSDQHLTVQWNKVRFFSGGLAGDTLTFQAQLFADGRIFFNYLDLVSGSAAGNNGGSATVGVKAAGTQGPDRLLLAFNNGPNGFVGSGQSTLVQQPAGEDWYSFHVDVGSPLRFSTGTPADGPGEFVNNLDPTIELYDPAGNLIATGGALTDGRNEAIGPVFAAVTGNYRVRVSAEADTLGEYALGLSQSGAMLIDDPCIEGQQAIVIGGTSGNDLIQFKQLGGTTQAWLNNVLVGTYGAGLRVIAYGHGGNDTVENLTNNPAMFFGGEGNDALKSVNGLAVLVGGAGNDSEIASGNGRDLLIGGTGADSMRGGNGEDILIGGSTAYDAGTPDDLVDLCEALEFWGNEELSYAARTGALLAGAFSSGNVISDADADTLRGESGRDWFFGAAPDVFPDKAGNELLS